MVGAFEHNEPEIGLENDAYKFASSFCSKPNLVHS
jgi:hypothetical protein